MFPFLNNSKCLPSISKLKFQRCSDAVSKRNQSFSNRWCPGAMPARISAGGTEGIFSVTEGRGHLISHSSSAWLSFPMPDTCSEVTMPVSSCFLSFRCWIIYLHLQVSAAELVSGWRLAMDMYEGCQPVSWIRSPICVFCAWTHGLSDRKGLQEDSGPRRVRAEFRPCCTRLCPLGSWKSPR